MAVFKLTLTIVMLDMYMFQRCIIWIDMSLLYYPELTLYFEFNLFIFLSIPKHCFLFELYLPFLMTFWYNMHSMGHLILLYFKC